MRDAYMQGIVHFVVLFVVYFPSIFVFLSHSQVEGPGDCHQRPEAEHGVRVRRHSVTVPSEGDDWIW